MDKSTPLEEIKTWEHPPWYGITQRRDFLWESEGSLPPPQDSLPDEPIDDFWSMSGNFKNRHHVEPRVKLYSLREESFPIHLKYIDVTRTTHTNLDVKQEKRIDDYWNVDGSRDLSDLGQVSHNLLYSKKKLLTDVCGLGGRLTRKQLTSRPDHLWPEIWKTIGKKCQAEGEAKVVEWEAPSGKRTKITRDLFHWPWGQGVQGNHQERA